MLWIVTSVTKSVKAIVQVMGPQKSPSFPSDIEDARNWYERVCSCVKYPWKIFDNFSVFPRRYTLNSSHDGAYYEAKGHKKTWNYYSYRYCPSLSDLLQLTCKVDAIRQIHVISHGLPGIKQFVKEKLSTSPLSNRTNIILSWCDIPQRYWILLSSFPTLLHQIYCLPLRRNYTDHFPLETK